MATMTKAQLEARIAALEAGLAGAQDEANRFKRELRLCAQELTTEKQMHADTYAALRELKQSNVPMAEYRRVQGVLRRVQQAQAARAASPRVAPSFKERCTRYFAATNARSVTPSELRNWELANA